MKKRELNNSSDIPKYFFTTFYPVLLDQKVLLIDPGSSATTRTQAVPSPSSLPQNVFHRIIKNQNKKIDKQRIFWWFDVTNVSLDSQKLSGNQLRAKIGNFLILSGT